MVFVNNFFAWVSAEGLRSSIGIIDKYIGDELMILFSTEFGSEEPFVEAIQTARWMCEHDALDFVPHVGFASGQVTVGYVDAPIKYNCSAFGKPVALAARCASVDPPADAKRLYSSRIVFPSVEWKDHRFENTFPPRRYDVDEGEAPQEVQTWEMLETRNVQLKNIGKHEIREAVKQVHHMPSISPEERARFSSQILAEQGRYWPRE